MIGEVGLESHLRLVMVADERLSPVVMAAPFLAVMADSIRHPCLHGRALALGHHGKHATMDPGSGPACQALPG